MCPRSTLGEFSTHKQLTSVGMTESELVSWDTRKSKGNATDATDRRDRRRMPRVGSVDREFVTRVSRFPLGQSLSPTSRRLVRTTTLSFRHSMTFF